MAKILAPYPLCPLIEHRNFLGVSDDALSDCVIVTLSRNMVIRFRLSDQKQLSSWSTMYKLTAPVVYDFFNNRFIGVFNCDEIAFWDEKEEQLNKLKKYQFLYLIHSIVSSKDVPPHIVFMNGSVIRLTVDKETRKAPAEDFVISSSEDIEEAKLVSILGNYYVALCTVKKNSTEKSLYFIPIDDGRKKVCLKLEHPDKSFLNFTTTESDSTSYLITLWSNGDVCSLELPAEDGSFGRLVGNINFINLSEYAALFPISEDQVVIYGAHCSGEGAVLAIYSIKFGAQEALEQLKVHNKIGKSLVRPRELIIPSGASLLVVPYKLYTPRLAGLVGSQATPAVGSLEELRKQGVPESRICEALLPYSIESKNGKSVLNILEMCNDIPDEQLVKSLGFALNKEKQSEVSEAIIEKVLKHLLVGSSTSLKLIREHIDLKAALFLLKKLANLISENPGNRVYIDWACFLLDAHYQEYLLSKDPEVKETVKNVATAIAEQLKLMDELKQVSWDVKNLLRGNRVKKPTVASRSYLIETIELY